MAAPLPDIITIVRGLPHDGEGLTEPNRVISVPDHGATIEVEQALLSA